MTDDPDESRLSRWSRMKRRKPDAEAESPEAAPAPPPPEIVQPEIAPPEIAQPETPEDEAALLAHLDLPAPETLGPGDDFSRFMTAEVPGFLRRRALRVLWRSNPDLAALDGLVDYGEDFRAGPVGAVIETAYRVGRGFLPDPDDREDDQEDNRETAPETIEDPARTPPTETAETAETAADNTAESNTDQGFAAPGDPLPDESPDRENVTEKSEFSERSSQASSQSPVEYDPNAPAPFPRPRRMVFTDDG